MNAHRAGERDVLDRFAKERRRLDSALKVVQAELAEAQTEYHRTRLRARAAEIRDQIAMNRSAPREAIRRMRGP